MTERQAPYTVEHILSRRDWTPRLFSFRLSRPQGFRFVPGQFARLGVRKEDGSIVWRAYSMVSAPYDDYLEFFSIVVPGGELTSRLSRLGAGDEVLLMRMNYGFLTTDRFERGQDLWLLATGTGLAPFLSILHDPQTWEDYARIVLVHSVRQASELAYRDELAALDAHPLIGEHAGRLQTIPVVTRERVEGALSERITTLIRNGELERAAGLALSPATSRVMICGNPEMVEDTRALLGELGFAVSRRASPGQLVVENAF